MSAPDPGSGDAVPSNLPAPLSTFIGRFDAIDTVARLVFDNRLVTLTGTGGAGKTRLAQQVAAEVTDNFGDGVWWVDLAAVEAPELVPSAVSRVASLPEDRADRLGGVVRRLGPTRTLLVLDNCEHLLDAVADAVVAILERGPEVAVLATSRTALDVPGEVTWRVPPLAEHEAVQLFADRAARARHGFAVDDDNAAAVAELCERLDGVPLAIELAAARCRSMSPAEILDGLGDSLGLLAGSRRSAAARHRTLDASIRWSHAVLTDEEQIAFRRLAAFPGSFDRDAAVAVLADASMSPTAVGRLLDQLVGHSLVQVDDSRTSTRFRLLEVVRQFAARELDAAGERDDVTARHADHYVERALALWPFFVPGLQELLEQADVEHANLAAMLGHLEEHASPERHAEVAMACLPAMGVRSAAEAATLGERVAARIDPLSVLGGRLHLQLVVVDPTMPAHVAAGIAAAEATGDPDLLTHAAFWEQWQAIGAEPTPAAIEEFTARCDALAATGEDHFSRTAWTTAGLHRSVGRHDEAFPHYHRAKETTVCKRCSVMMWGEGALLLLAAGDVAGAEEAAATSLQRAREIRDAGFTAHALATQTELALFTGTEPPVAALEAELPHALASGNPLASGYLREALATARFAAGDLDGVDEELAAADELLDGDWPKRTEARLRRAAVRHARSDLAGAAAVLDALRADAARWSAGPWLLGQIDHRAGALALDHGDAAKADELAHRALADAWLGPFPAVVVEALELLVAVAAARESWTEAARLHGAAAAQRDAVGYRGGFEPDRSRTTAAVEVTRGGLGDDAFDTAVAEGRRLSLEDAVSFARRARGERKRPTHGWDGLTPTERQVAELCVQGRTNAEIADRLLMGRETVKTHLSNVYAKVGVANRTQLVADAARRGVTT